MTSATITTTTTTMTTTLLAVTVLSKWKHTWISDFELVLVSSNLIRDFVLILLYYMLMLMLSAQIFPFVVLPFAPFRFVLWYYMIIIFIIGFMWVLIKATKRVWNVLDFTIYANIISTLLNSHPIYPTHGFDKHFAVDRDAFYLIFTLYYVVPFDILILTLLF